MRSNKCRCAVNPAPDQKSIAKITGRCTCQIHPSYTNHICKNTSLISTVSFQDAASLGWDPALAPGSVFLQWIPLQQQNALQKKMPKVTIYIWQRRKYIIWLIITGITTTTSRPEEIKLASCPAKHPFVLVRHAWCNKTDSLNKITCFLKDCGRLCCSDHMRSEACSEKVLNKINLEWQTKTFLQKKNP